jgi:hypothetical protein
MTTQYKLFSTLLSKEPTMVQRITENEVLCIPFDPANTDYQEFLKYQAEGGAVLPADDNEQTS